MNRTRIFNDAAQNAQPPQTSLQRHMGNLAMVLEAADDAFTYVDSVQEKKAMFEAFRDVVAEGIAAMRTTGAYSRSSGAVIGSKDNDILAALDEERAYQEAKVREQYLSQGRIFSYTEELAMMHSYFRREIESPLKKGDDAKAANGVRKLTALALRACENHG